MRPVASALTRKLEFPGGVLSPGPHYSVLQWTCRLGDDVGLVVRNLRSKCSSCRLLWSRAGWVLMQVCRAGVGNNCSEFLSMAGGSVASHNIGPDLVCSVFILLISLMPRPSWKNKSLGPYSCLGRWHHCPPEFSSPKPKNKSISVISQDLS
jgi:hypothetical protein